jgi:S-adenosyl-L-methionine hydrolase (adenosine-forming)
VSVTTLTTDFGVGSPYVAAMKGVILSIDPGAVLIDVTHAIAPQDIRQAALVLAEVAERFPPGTIHVAVVDPGVGTARGLVYAEFGSQRYLAPDNGLLSRVARQSPCGRLVRLVEREYWLAEVSSTFHGRDILAPVAARLGLGLDPERLGPPLERLVMLDWPGPRVTPDEIQGEVEQVDSFGNLVTNIPAELLRGVLECRELWVACAGREANGIARTYADRPRGSLVALVGSSGRLELAISGGNAGRELGVGVGAEVKVRWLDTLPLSDQHLTRAADRVFQELDRGESRNA